MESVRRALHPLLIAIADIGVGGLLYQQVSALLGLLLVVCGLSVLVTLAYEPMNLAGTFLRRRLSGLIAS